MTNLELVAAEERDRALLREARAAIGEDKP